MEYLPLYRIKGGTLKCEGENCELIVDTNVAHLYLFYIFEGNNEVGIIFEYHATSTESVSAGTGPNKSTGIGIGPVMSFGRSTTIQCLLIKMMTIDPVQGVKCQLQVQNPNLTISADNSIKRRLLNWHRRHQGLYTKESTLLEDDENLARWIRDYWTIKQNDGIFCVQCMKNKHGNHYKNAEFQFNGWAKFD